MRLVRTAFWVVLIAVFTASCSVISHDVRTAASSESFQTLSAEPDKYEGKIVVLGGYIEKTGISGDETVIHILQTPLSVRDRPTPRDKSQGKLIVHQEGVLDLTVYSGGRLVTVAGTLIGCTGGKVKTCTIKSRELHVWPEVVYDPSRYEHGAPEYDPYESSFPGQWY